MADSDAPVLLYDGECGLCAASVQFVLAHESSARRAALRFAPLNGPTANALLAPHDAARAADSVVWVDVRGSRVLLRSEAVLAAMRHMRGVWRLAAWVGSLVPRAWRDRAYAAVARRRQRWRAAACLLSPADMRSRFLP